MRLIVILAVVLSAVQFSPSAVAQATCELTPLTLPLFESTPLAQLSTPEATPASEALSEDEATQILEMYVACTNTGDPTLVWAMFTPRWFSSEFANSEEHYLPAFEYEIATGEDSVLNPLELVAVENIELQRDGRIAVTASFSSGDRDWTDQLILANVEGQWLIDEVVLISPAD